MTSSDPGAIFPTPGRGGGSGRETHMSLAEALRPFKIRFALACAYFFVILAIGTIGYRLIEGWGWFEALYMSVTTVASVGYMEVHPLSPAGRTFTMWLIVLGITGLGIWWALTTALIVELDLGGVLRRRRIMRRIKDLSDHYVVCGVGRMGGVILEEMLQAGVPFVAIEKNSERVALLFDQYPEALVVEGDATRETTLEAAQLARASGLAACLAEDADNLLVCFTARGLNPELRMVARAYNEESLPVLRRAGADYVIRPNFTGGIRMAFSLLRPDVVSFLDCAISGADIELRMEQATIPADSPLVGQTLAEAKIPQRTGLIVLGLRRRGAEDPPMYNPGPETRLHDGDVMIVLGRSNQVSSLRDHAGGEVTT